MKKIIFIILATFSISSAKAQNYVGFADYFNVISGNNVVPGSTTTTVNFTARVSRLATGTGWSPFYMNIKIGIAATPGGAIIEYVSPVYTITSSNFNTNYSYFENNYSFSVNSSKLTNNYYLILCYNIPNAGSTYYQPFYSYAAKISNPPPGPVIDPAHLAKIQSMGFSTDGIKDFNTTYYLVENDVLIRKNSLGISSPLYAVNNDKEHNINIWVKTAVKVNSDWHNAILLAVSAWNANPTSDIKLHLVYQYGTLDVPPPYDIIIDSDLGVLPSNQPKAVEYANGNGKPGETIMANLDYNFSFPTQATNHVIHAIGHSLGLKHNNASNSIMMNSNLTGNNAFPSSVDEPVISTLYPLNVGSIVTPYISGITNLLQGWSQDYNMSYFVIGQTYNWNGVGINGTSNPDFPFSSYTNSLVSEAAFVVGNYQIQCSIAVSKYATLATATKNIIVQ